MKSVEELIREEIVGMLNETELLGLPELAEYLTRLSPETYTQEDMVYLLQQEYSQGGDEAVRKFFREQTNIDLNILGRGKYAFKY